MAHPLGILPEGLILMNAGGTGISRSAGLGSLHTLSDALILEMCGHLDARSLSSLSLASKACYCFSATEDLWKAHVLEEFQGGFTWNTASPSWRAAYATSKQSQAAATDISDLAGQSPGTQAIARNSSPAGAPGKKRTSSSCEVRLQAQHGSGKRRRKGSVGPPTRSGWFFSDLLYQPWHCATAELQPEWLEVSNVDRKRNLSPTAFREQYELQNRPVVLVDGAAEWPALKKWSTESLGRAFAGKEVIAGSYPMPFPTYAAYANTTLDEMPLYLFDKEFVAKAPQLAKDFSVPSVFNEDLFGVLGSSRPDYRWLIVGPARSGSSFHVDPNATSAWNAVVRGSKKWILFPPGIIPPGVHPSPDGADVATPVSVMEWFLNFYSAARELKTPPFECVVGAGEVIFVPRGWWHACLNLETMTIAVTQNYVSSANVAEVLRFIRPGRSDLISGCALDERAHLHGRFLSALKQQRPDVVQMVERQEEARRARKEQESKLSSLFSTSKTGGSGQAVQQQQGDLLPSKEAAPPEKPAGTFCFNFSV